MPVPFLPVREGCSGVGISGTSAFTSVFDQHTVDEARHLVYIAFELGRQSEVTPNADWGERRESLAQRIAELLQETRRDQRECWTALIREYLEADSAPVNAAMSDEEWRAAFARYREAREALRVAIGEVA